MRVLGLIPARGGSKGIPGKNIRLLCGQPLLAYTVQAAQAAQGLDHLILSTDDPTIAQVGHGLGVRVPFLRPAALARDESPTLPVVLHAVRFLEAQGQVFDAVCLLQPTNPLRTSNLIDHCLRLLAESDASAVMTVLPVPAKYNPHWTYFQTEAAYLHPVLPHAQPITRRQDLPPAYHREGGVYVVRRDVLLEQKSLYGERVMGVPVEPHQSINLDTEDDWQRAEALLCPQGVPPENDPGGNV